MLKPVLSIVVVVVVALGVAFPSVYAYQASKLPRLEGELDVLSLLKHSIESDRLAVKAPLQVKGIPHVEFERPELKRLPEALVNMHLAEWGCPAFLKTPSEEGWPWARRVLASVLDKPLEGVDGWCERVLTANLVRRLGVNETLEVAVATHKLHHFMSKDLLVAYDLTSVWFEPGVVGVEAASQNLYQKPLADLSLAELAELELVLPPHGYWEQLKQCQNPMLIKQNRDTILKNLAESGGVAREALEVAQAAPVACLKP